MKIRRAIFRFQRYFIYHWKLFQDKRTPLISKILLIIAIIYILSPIDIVPDVIPVAGFLDEVIIIPLMFYLATRFIPKEIINEYKNKKDSRKSSEEIKKDEAIEGEVVD